MNRSESTPGPCVLVVADPGRVQELAAAFADPLPSGPVDVVVTSGGDDTIDMFDARAPRVVVLTASLEVGDAKSLIETLREMVSRDRMVIVLVGDDDGPIRTALDAIDMKPDRFVSRPLSVKALRFAVQSGLETVARALGESPNKTVTDDAVGAAQSFRSPADIEAAGRSPTAGGTSPGTPVGASPAAISGPAIVTPADASTATAASAATASHSATATASGPSTAAVGAAARIAAAAAAPRPAISDAFSAVLTSGAADEPDRVGATGRGDHADAASDVASIRSPAPPRETADTERKSNGEASARYDIPSIARAPTDRGTGIALIGPASGAGGSASAVAPASGDIAAQIARGNDDTAPGAPGTQSGFTASGAESTDADSSQVPGRAALRARWAALADSIGDDEELLDDDDVELIDDHAPPLPPIEIAPRRKGNTNPEFMPVPPVAPWRPGTTSELHEEPGLVPVREPTLILHEELPNTPMPSLVAPLDSPSATAERESHERRSQPVLLSQLIDRSRESSRELLANVHDDLGSLDEVDDDLIVGHPARTPPPHVLRGGGLQALEDLIEAEPPPDVARQTPVAEPTAPPDRPSGGGRDFARQLRAKMSMMAQRLFQSESPAQPSVDIRPRHDHHTEIDLAALGEEPALGGGVTEIESRGTARPPLDTPPPTTAPGSWDTQVRERGLPSSGELVRGVSDAALIIAKMFAQSFTGRVAFGKDEVEKVVYFDQGRPVFASSNEPGDRMGELLVREGKITASQYERCQVHVAQSGRRMGEILVDFGYLKRRELLPAVRRHVEDILYSLFGWDHGLYHITVEPTASAERIRLSRHPASLVLEGIRRKLDRTTLEKLLGPGSTIVEVPDREKLGGIINVGDLAAEERAALAAFDGNADLAQVARTTSVDVADVLPLAWGLCVLGLATARRTEPDPAEESTALVGETDLAIDRERVHARWSLVAEADYFALLGVRRDATAFEIRRAYQAARRDFAADCFPQDLRRELARELDDIASVLDEAFRVLRDDRLRVTYLANLIE